MAHYLNLEGLGTFLNNIKNNVKGWLGINASSGSSTKFLNEQGNFASLKALAFKDTVGTSDIADDAVTAAKVKDNETLPVSISGTARGQYVPRSNGNLNDQYSKYDFNVVEYQNTASNRPTPNGWYFSLAMCGGDSDFGAQIATGMTIDRIFWRNKQEGTPGAWREIPSFPGTTGVGSPTLPVYVDSDGSVKSCGFQVNFGTPIAGANVLNIITA